MATRKQIQVVKKMLGETHRASNALMTKENYRSRSGTGSSTEVEKPFNPSPGSTERYLDWCRRMELDPAQRRSFDGYFGTRQVMQSYYPSSQFTMTPERFEALLGSGEKRWVSPDHQSEWESKHRGGSWWAILSIFKTTELEDHRDYDGYNPNRLLHLQIRIKYSFFHDHSEIDTHWTIGFKPKTSLIKGSVTSEYHPANNWATPEEIALDLAELMGQKISWEQRKTIAIRFQPYVYRRPPKGVRWCSVRPGLSRKRKKDVSQEEIT